MSAWLSQVAPPAAATSAPIMLAGQALVAERCGALWWPAERTLVIADMHLEKGSSFARFGMHVPPYDTAATLAQLAAMIRLHQPRRVIALGDSVHDGGGWERLGEADRASLQALCAQVDQWIWVAGNHDPLPPQGVAGTSAQDVIIGSLVFRHEPGGALASGQGEVAGHLHPAARVIAGGGSSRRPAFAHDGRRLVLPAFGAYAGGLCLSSAAFRPLFARASLRASVCGRTRVFTVAGSSVVGWR